MIRYIFLVLCLHVAYFAHAQVISVKEEGTMRPVRFASLSSESPRAHVIANSDGRADISALKGSEAIQVRSVGYKTVTKSYAEIEALGLEVYLVPSNVEMDELVISASRWAQAANELPQRVSTISKRDIALLSPQTAADLLGNTGEVFVQKSQQGGGSPMIRGFATSRLLYAVDGVRMNSAIFRAGNIQNVISLDAFATESAEVLFGPGSIIYGSDAIGGVMSFQTLTPQLALGDKPSTGGSVAARYSSANNETTGHFDFGIGWDKWASVTSFTYSRFGDLRMGSNGPDEYLRRFYVVRLDSMDRVVENPNPNVQTPSGYSQVNMMQKLRFRPNKQWDFQYGFHYSETSEYPRYDRLIELQANGRPRSAVWNYGPQIWMMNHLTATHTGGNALYDQMTIRLAHQYFEESRIDRNFSGGQRFRLRTNLEEVRAISVNVDFEKSLRANRVFYGVEYISNDVKSVGSAIDIRDGRDIPVPDRYPQSDWGSYAVYLNVQRRISDKVLVQAGARHNFFDVKSNFARHLEFYPFDFVSTRVQNAATTGSLGMVYKPAPSWKISANASTGFRSPNVDDMGKIFDIAPGEVVVPNTALKAEYAYNAELNISKVFGNVVKLDATGFYTYLDNAMVRRGFQVNGRDSILYDGQLSRVFAIQNAAYGTVYGLNLGIEIKLPAGFAISTRYNYQLGKEELDNGELSRSRHAAPAFGVSRLTFTGGKLTAQLYAMYSAEVSAANLNIEERGKPAIYAKDTNGQPYSPAWYTLNLKATHSISDQLSATVGVENLTDQRYRPYSSGIVAPGRNFVISLRADF
jgi:hemoglobin/transferrin/lactoferrin receptor protein